MSDFPKDQVFHTGNEIDLGDPARKGGWMQTYTGGRFYPGDPRPEDVNIIDIAHAISQICRFGGHCKRFYSVAEHSVHCSTIVPPQFAMQALMHDATEAYVVDVPRPLKVQLTNYAEIEALNWEAIRAALPMCNLPSELDPSVKAADNGMLLAERDQLLDTSQGSWSIPGAPADVRIKCWDPKAAEAQFLFRYAQLLFMSINPELRKAA